MLTISTFSLILLKSVSRAMNTDYFKTQLVVTVAGLLAALVLSFIDYESIASFWYLIAGFSVFIMLYTMFFGISVQGSEGVNARAWISLAGRTFQTSELVKICFMLTYAKHISVLRVQNKINHPLHVVLLALHAAVPVLLCHVQGDDGAAIVFFFMFLCMSLGGGVQLRYFILLGALVAVSVPVLWKFVLSEYQIKRFTSVYNLDDPSIQLNEGYQQVQGRISIGSGQLTGKGLFNGPRVETNLVTFQHSDFIFSVAGEELGFIGAVIIIVLFALLVWRGFMIGMKAPDKFGSMLAIGLTAQVGIQVVFNMAVVTNTIPNTGISLPFFSYGGTSLVMLLAQMGIVLSISRQMKKSGGSG